MLNTYQQQFIQLALKQKALCFGQFTLKSGRLSPYFFNMGLLNTGQSLSVLGECYAAALKESNLKMDLIFGPAYKGIPLAVATATALFQKYEWNVPYAFNRKEIKDHGEGGNIIGHPLQGRKVLIVDDVITKGTAITEALSYIQQGGGQPSGIIIAVDRQERGTSGTSAVQEISSQLHIPVIPLITLQQLVTYLRGDPQLQAYLPAMERYREEYGV